MLAEKFAKLLLSGKQYKKIKAKYRKLRQKIHPKLSEPEFRKILSEKLGIKRGSVVFIHSSIYQLYLNFDAIKTLNILIDLVGDEGTLLFPCTQLREKMTAEVYFKKGDIFDIKRTLPKMGLLPLLAMMHKNAFRSLHPTNSIVAIGKYAKELTSDHSESIYPCGEKSPYYKIINFNGIIVGLGVSSANSLTFLHTVEDVLKEKFPVQTRRKEIYNAKVRDQYGNERVIPTLIAHPNSKYRKITRYMNKYISKDICKDFRIKMINFYKADASMLFNRMSELALNNITIYSKEAYKESNRIMD
jgi:aminoglycoside 3-N-acetyltransferase